MSWLFAGFLSFSAIAADPLLSKMEGQWIGQGVRVHRSGKQVQVRSEVTSVLEENRLISTNRITEMTPGEARRYQTRYWIRPKAGTAIEYELSAGSGRFENGVFEVVQVLTPEVRVVSRTTFPEDGTVEYTEIGWHLETQLSQTQIRYTRGVSVPFP